MPRPKKSPKPPTIETDINGKPLSELAFKVFHPKSDLRLERLDPASRAEWEKMVMVIAAAVRAKDAAQMRKAA